MPLDTNSFSNSMTIAGHLLETSTTSHMLLVDKQFLIRLTPTESAILFYLLSKPEMLIQEQELARVALQTRNEQMDDHLSLNIQRHISSIRRKLEGSRLRIYRVIDIGWLLGSDNSES